MMTAETSFKTSSIDHHCLDLSPVGIRWYADYPSHYCSDGIPATVEKGNCWLDARARAFARVIRAIKDDRETRRLQDGFLEK